jgi:SnoaL-like domain
MTVDDRLAIRELFDAYAHCADRRDAEGQKALFTDDTRFTVYMDGEGSEPTYVLQGREALTPVFEDLNRYEVTTHFNGQSTVRIDGDGATGESYTIAHHLYSRGSARSVLLRRGQRRTDLRRWVGAARARSRRCVSGGSGHHPRCAQRDARDLDALRRPRDRAAGRLIAVPPRPSRIGGMTRSPRRFSPNPKPGLSFPIRPRRLAA